MRPSKTAHLSDDQVRWMREAKDEAITKAGGPGEVAKLFEISTQAIGQWDLVPAERVVPLSTASGVPPHRLRSDLYPEPATQLPEAASA
jgi:hypothetical protein